jgi:hypothetical protein
MDVDWPLTPMTLQDVFLPHVILSQPVVARADFVWKKLLRF